MPCWQTTPPNVLDCLTTTKFDSAPLPIFDTIWIAGNEVDDDVVNPMTNALPWAAPVGFTVRSGDIAPLNTYRLLFLTVPDWKMVGEAFGVGWISYQFSWAPAPPSTLWAVQIMSRPVRGSIAETACSRRPSSVSSTFVVPCWGASGGDSKLPTVMEW